MYEPRDDIVRTLGLLIMILAMSALGGPLAAQDRDVPSPDGSAEVVGRVIVEDRGAPVASAEVELWLAADSVVAGSAVTDADGHFRIEDVPEGEFFVRVSSLGYGTVSTREFEVAAAETRSLGELRMPVDALEVEPITVSAERTAVTDEADRTIYNVGVMPGTEGTSVTETLSQIPELQVDIDGRVTLRGQEVSIYIDGREAPMSGEALAILMEQFPTELLQEIELMENPSARYDAEGTGGIVNLVTKEGVELGMSGAVFTRADTRGQYGIGGRGTLQRGKWTVDGGGYVRLSDDESTDYELRQNLDAEPAYLRQDLWSDRSGLSTTGDLEMEYEPGEDSQIYLEGRISASDRDNGGLTTTTHLSDLETTILAFDRARDSDSRGISFDLATGFEHQWGAREDEIEVELEYERGTEHQDSREEIGERDGAGFGEDVLIPAELTLENEDELETELSLEVDYAREWGADGEIEVGYEAGRTDTDAGRRVHLVEDPTTMDGELSERGHLERERSHELYTTLERRVGDLSAQVGLRAEYTDQQFELPDGRTFGQIYRNLFPSAHVSYRLDDDRRLRLSYSRRVNRPGISVLDPTDTSTDPLERRVGNPDIDPQFTHRVTMSASWSLPTGSLRLSPHYSTTRNGWSEMTTVDAQGVSTRTYRNIASRVSYGASLTYRLRQRDGWRGNVSLSGRSSRRDASNLDARYSGTSLRLSSRVNLNGRITDNLSAQGNFGYEPPQDLPQGRRDARYRADFGLRYRMMGDRTSVRLALRDPFGLRGSSSRLRDEDYILIGRSEESTRSAQLSVSYSFGGPGDGSRRRR